MSVAPVAATTPFTWAVAWNPAPTTAIGPPGSVARCRAARPVAAPVRSPLIRPPPMTARSPLPSAAESTIWNDAPLADTVYIFWPTTLRSIQPAGMTLYAPPVIGTRTRGRLTISPRARARNISSSASTTSGIVSSPPISASVRYRAILSSRRRQGARTGAGCTGRIRSKDRVSIRRERFRQFPGLVSEDDDDHRQPLPRLDDLALRRARPRPRFTRPDRAAAVRDGPKRRRSGHPHLCPDRLQPGQQRVRLRGGQPSSRPHRPLPRHRLFVVAGVPHA